MAGTEFELLSYGQKQFNWILFIDNIFFVSCIQKPIIPISETLEQGLGNRYNNYVTLLNKSVQFDSSALLKFLEIDDIYDGASYDHGWILARLMEKVGDEKFSFALAKMDKKQVNIFLSYFQAGLDLDESINLNNNLSKKFPLSFKLLGNPSFR